MQGSRAELIERLAEAAASDNIAKHVNVAAARSALAAASKEPAAIETGTMGVEEGTNDAPLGENTAAELELDIVMQHWCKRCMQIATVAALISRAMLGGPLRASTTEGRTFKIVYNGNVLRAWTPVE